MRRPFDDHVGHVAMWLTQRGRTLRPRRMQAQRFLRLLDPDATFFSFRIFSATPYTRVPGTDPLERAIHGSLDECWEELVLSNQAGAAISVTINASNGQGRTPTDIGRVRALFVDDDHPRARTRGFPLAPHMSVTSSPGRFHHYWLVRGFSLDRFAQTQRRLARSFGTDHKVCALNQSMALPGFWRRKRGGADFRTIVRDTAPSARLGREEIEALLE